MTTEMPENVAAKVKSGHAMEWDPPAAMTLAVRWTCTDRNCGAAVLDYQGNVYGSATEKTCDEVRADYEALFGAFKAMRADELGGVA